MKVYFIEVIGMDGMVGRHAKKSVDQKPKKIPFETEFDTLAAFEAALKRGPVIGYQLIYEGVPSSWKRRITKRIQMRLKHENCGSIAESRIDFIEPESAK